MTPENFCYWLRGIMEVINPKTLTEKQVEIIKNHLDLVFEKITPDVDLAEIKDINEANKSAQNLLEQLKDFKKLTGQEVKWLDKYDEAKSICSAGEKLDHDKIAKALRASYHRPWNGPTHYC